MKSSIILATAAVALASTILSANAGCADPRNVPGATHQIPIAGLKAPGGVNTPGNAAKAVVGTWLATYSSGGSPAGQAFIQWHSDGTEWENINFPISGGNICLGSWVKVDSTHVSRNHYGWLYDNGDLSGYFNETETDAVAKNGTYTGDNDTKIYDLNGNLLTEFTGTVAATIISP